MPPMACNPQRAVAVFIEVIQCRQECIEPRPTAFAERMAVDLRRDRKTPRNAVAEGPFEHVSSGRRFVGQRWIVRHGQIFIGPFHPQTARLKIQQRAVARVRAADGDSMRGGEGIGKIDFGRRGAALLAESTERGRAQNHRGKQAQRANLDKRVIQCHGLFLLNCGIV